MEIRRHAKSILAFLALQCCLSEGFLTAITRSTGTGYPSLQGIARPRNGAFQLRLSSSDTSNEGEDEEAERYRKQAEEIREQIRKMEAEIGDKRPRNYDAGPPSEIPNTFEQEPETMSLRNRRVLVIGANGRLGSMVCRYLLRNNPNTEVVACCHYIGEDSITARGYGRLSYEVGAEDGRGTIGPAWSAEDRTATFEYTDAMKGHNLRNLRLVEAELLDPVQCQTIVEGVDSVVWCATDFNGNKPRAVSGLNVAFLFRAVADPTKGRVEIEGLQNILGALKNEKQSKAWNENKVFGGGDTATSRPIDFVLTSTSPNAFKNFETPFGEFNAMKRQAEDILRYDFPSLSYTILQMGKYEDNFIEEGLEIQFGEPLEDPSEDSKRKINRRDAARAVSEALTNEELVGETKQVWTGTR